MSFLDQVQLIDIFQLILWVLMSPFFAYLAIFSWMQIFLYSYIYSQILL